MRRWTLHLVVDAGALLELLASELEFLLPRVEAGVVPTLELTVAAPGPQEAVAYADDRLRQALASVGIGGVRCQLVDISAETTPS